MTARARITIGRKHATIEDVAAVASGAASVQLTDDPETREAVAAGAAFVEQLWREGQRVYGVTTGYGASAEWTVSTPLVEELPRQLVRFHRCGLGRFFDQEATAAIVVTRLVALSKGYSGVRWELLERLAWMINERVLPFIPEEGSVGASGDLTPLAYVAAAVLGEGSVWHAGEERTALDVLRASRLEPLELRPKEALALMNGTSVMTALACLAFRRAAYLARLASHITAAVVVALRGNEGQFDGQLFRLKNHPGQSQVAAWIRDDLGLSRRAAQHGARLQDTYAVRCAPHVIGVLADALPWMRQQLETELNSVNDNPIVDGIERRVLHGGHFYGGHIAFAMDALKTAVANIADLLDRQVALLVDPRTNQGLPANLSGAQAERTAINHGFKAVQIATSAWTAEALKLTVPASVFSRSTECHNQDKVSMGTIAARDALRVLELTEQVSAAALAASLQGCSLRSSGSSAAAGLPPEIEATLSLVRQRVPFLEDDRPFDQDLRWLVGEIRRRAWPLGLTESEDPPVP